MQHTSVCKEKAEVELPLACDPIRNAERERSALVAELPSSTKAARGRGGPEVAEDFEADYREEVSDPPHIPCGGATLEPQP